MYASNQINGLAGYVGEVRQGSNGELYQLGEVMDERGNVGLAWQPYDQPQLGEVRQGADGRVYQYSMDGLGNVGFAPLAALAAQALPALMPTIAKAIPTIANAIPGVSNLVKGLIPGMMPGASGSLPTPPSLPGIPNAPVPAPFPGSFRSPFSGQGRGFFMNQLAPHIANVTAEMVIEKIKPLLAASSRRPSVRGRRGRRGVSGIGEDPYLYGVGERDYEGMGEQDFGLAYDDLGENDPYLNDSMGDYDSVNGMDGYVKGPISSGPAFVSREPASDLWKPLW